ncbi:MAG: hypothetical protein OWT27_05745 [Firmicutes bacterium]|nr:hypothetical protein [Bacillota bacterium]
MSWRRVGRRRAQKRMFAKQVALAAAVAVCLSVAPTVAPVATAAAVGHPQGGQSTGGDAPQAGMGGGTLRELALPIYPNATQKHLDQYTVHLHASDGWEIGSARFATLAPLDRVIDWYAVHMRAAGYAPESRETVHGGRERVPGWYVIKNVLGLTVQIEFSRSARKPGLVWISYHVVYAPLRQRPVDTVIAGDAERVVIHYRAAADVNTGKWLVRTLTDVQQVQQLVRAIDALQVDTRAHVRGEQGLYGGAWLLFREPGGVSQRVRIEFARNQVWVADVPLFDPADSVWLIVSRDMGQRPYPTD